MQPGRKSRVAATAVLAAVLLSGTAPAWAGTTFNYFSTTIGAFGGNGYTSYQTKTASNVAGNLSVTFVGDSRTIGASMLRTDNTQEGTKRYDLAAGDSTTLPNTIGSGLNAKLKVWGNPVWVVAVQAAGNWRTN